MGWEAGLTITVIVVCLVLLASNRFAADTVLFGGVTLLLVSGILTPAQALAGLANEGVVTIGVLYVVVAGLQATGGMGWMADAVLGTPRSIPHAQWRMGLPILALSPFLNNTPVVAMFIPAVAIWARRFRLPISQLMIPLAYMTTAAGLCTLAGSSTNLVVNGLLRDKAGLPGFSLWELLWIGLPVTATVYLYTILWGIRLLPHSAEPSALFANVREYTVEMVVEQGGALHGKTVEAAKLRQLPGLFLVEIQRQGEVLPAVSSQQILAGGDRLIFTGNVESVADLRNMRGLLPATDQVFKLDAPVRERAILEAVVAEASPLVGMTVRRGQFRTVYNAAILAIVRNGAKVPGKIGNIVLRAGDLLLLEAHSSFLEQQRHSRDFLLVRSVENYQPVFHRRAPVALAILLAFILLATLGGLSTLESALIAAGMMLVTGCVNSTAARRTVEWPILLVIAASIALGTAMEKTGVARFMADQLISALHGGPWVTLATLYLTTALLTQMVTNNATAVLMFPIALSAANTLHLSPVPFAVVVLVAASSSFVTSIGYQTNLMVQGAGGYRFLDYVRFGWPLPILVGSVTVALVPRIWPF
ncbi:MAG: SLC13 family permease [Magnetococcales bacterium]|nr:SLC13 family permease [Magnetococcales bacterium]